MTWDCLVTALPSPTKTPDLDEIRRMVAQASAVRPEGDRFAMSQAMHDTVRLIGRPTTQLGAFGPQPFGIRVFIDDSLPPNVIEFRDGDRVLKRIEHDPHAGQPRPISDERTAP